LFIYFRLENPCLNTEDEFCAPVFGFRHQLEITANGGAFINAVNSTKISGNIDTPEGGFDALMQIAVCEVRLAIGYLKFNRLIRCNILYSIL